MKNGLNGTLVLLIILIPLLILAWLYFSESRKEKDTKPVAPTEEKKSSDLICSPQITVIFQKDLMDDEDLVSEIADMYISNRTYYYTGRPLEREVLSEKDIFIRYENIDFSSLEEIDT